MFILRELLVPLAIYEMLVYGIILCIFFLFMPRGIRGLMNPILKWFKEDLEADGTGITPAR
jgi:ABC-type branched-subunit amino acid transport system permease subunit